MPKEALPDHLRFDLNPDAWKGTDNASWLMRLKKRIQTVFAGSHRVPKGFWKFREFPTTIFTVRGKGAFRLESSTGDQVYRDNDPRYRGLIWWEPTDPDQKGRVYLSRIQIWCRWHFAIQYPLFIQGHVFWRERDIVPWPDYQSDFGISKYFSFQAGWKRDSDGVSWPTVFIGGNAE